MNVQKVITKYNVVIIEDLSTLFFLKSDSKCCTIIY